MAHICQAILFRCMDFRLTREINRWMEENNLMNNCDIASMAGASKDIIDGLEKERDMLFKQIDLSIKLHQSREVYLIHHSQCGAYKASYDFSSEGDEKEQQLKDLERIKGVIKEKFPEIEVKIIWAQMLDEEGNNIQFSEIS